MNDNSNESINIAILQDEEKFRRKVKEETVSVSVSGSIAQILGGGSAVGGTVAAKSAAMVTTIVTTETSRWTIFGIGIGKTTLEVATTTFSLAAFGTAMLPVAAVAGGLVVGGVFLQKLNANTIAKARFNSAVDGLASVVCCRVFTPLFCYMKLNREFSSSIKKFIVTIMSENWGYTEGYSEQCASMFEKKSMEQIFTEIKSLKEFYGDEQLTDKKEIQKLQLEKIAEKLLRNEIASNFFFLNSSKTDKDSELTEKIIKICLGQWHWKTGALSLEEQSEKKVLKEFVSSLPAETQSECSILLMTHAFENLDKNAEEFKIFISDCAKKMDEISSSTNSKIDEAGDALNDVEKIFEKIRSMKESI